MTIKLDESVRAMFYVTLPGADWLASVHQREGDTFECLYRFRYYTPGETEDQFWESRDIKNWYRITGRDLAHGIAGIRTTAQQLKERAGGELWELERGTGSLEEFAAQLKALPFAHVKVLPAPVSS